MALKIQKTSDAVNKYINLLVYGDAGTGKTSFAGTSIKRFKPLILSAESGLLSLNKLGKFDFIQVTRYEEIDEARQFLRYSKHDYDTVILDSLTEIQSVCEDKIMRDEKIEKLRIQDFGTLGQRMTTMIRDLRDMNMNLIATALADTRDDQESGVSKTGPLMKGKVKDLLPAYFDEVFYLSVKTGKDAQGKPVSKRLLQTQGTDRVIAKDRSGLLPAYVEPDFCTVYDLIFNEPTKA
jgi:phage nucleotide-binding protein